MLRPSLWMLLLHSYKGTLSFSRWRVWSGSFLGPHVTNYLLLLSCSKVNKTWQQCAGAFRAIAPIVRSTLLCCLRSSSSISSFISSSVFSVPLLTIIKNNEYLLTLCFLVICTQNQARGHTIYTHQVHIHTSSVTLKLN